MDQEGVGINSFTHTTTCVYCVNKLHNKCDVGTMVDLFVEKIVKLREREGHRVDSGSHSKVIYRL